MSKRLDGALKTHRLPLQCRFCGQDDPEKLVKLSAFVEGRDRVCKTCHAERVASYKKGETPRTYVGNQVRDEPGCNLCEDTNPAHLVKNKNARCGLATICKPCKAKLARERTANQPMACKGCGTKAVKNLVHRLGVPIRICKTCKAAEIPMYRAAVKLKAARLQEAPTTPYGAVYGRV